MEDWVQESLRIELICCRSRCRPASCLQRNSGALPPISLFAPFFTYDCNTRPTYHHAMAAKGSAAIDTSAIMGNILVIRGHRVLLDSDLAALYQVETECVQATLDRTQFLSTRIRQAVRYCGGQNPCGKERKKDHQSTAVQARSDSDSPRARKSTAPANHAHAPVPECR